VPGRHIKENSIKMILANNLKDKMISFEHTWLFSKSEGLNKKAKISRTNENIRIGFVGSIRKERWLEDIFKFRKSISSKFSVIVVGRVFCLPELLIDNNIEYIADAEKGFISNFKIEKHLKSVDIIVFLYPIKSYKLVCSGSVFDAINAEKYILALKNDCFNSLINRNSDIGQLFDNVEDLSEHVNAYKNASQIPNPNYKEIKKALSPDHEALILKGELIRIDCYSEV